jgi:N-acetylglutamate synthase-like GNAT family acetyltransferase
MQLKIREARDDDAEQLIDLIEACYSEYDGCVLAVDEEVPELRAIASKHAEQGGRFWVAERNGELVGCAGLVPSSNGTMELKKLYVAKDCRSNGLGARLCSLVEVEAVSRGASNIELWSDTRFKDAHRLYERRGYTRGKTRELQDLSKSVEYYYRKDLSEAAHAPRRPAGHVSTVR